MNLLKKLFPKYTYTFTFGKFFKTNGRKIKRVSATEYFKNVKK